jgi:23S rRNA (cytosine1962-C5)-methyltransferase
VDDALKFVQREARRGVKYDGIILDPPKFGRGPKGEVWEVYKSLPESILGNMHECLSENPLVRRHNNLRGARVGSPRGAGDGRYDEGVSCGKFEMGELVTREQSAGRLLSQAVYARWSAND